MIELIITSIVSVVISLGGSFVFFKEKKKDIEVDTLNKVIDTLQEENSRKKEDLNRKDVLIDKLYADNAIFRDKNNALIYQNAFFRGRKRNKISIQKGFNAFNSPFQNYPSLVDLANQYIFIPKEIMHAYKKSL